MAVLASNDFGWIISHEVFIKKLFEKTTYFHTIKSFCFKPALFDIKIPFVKGKNVDNCKKLQSVEVDTVQKIYYSLFTLFKTNGIPEDFHSQNNHCAKSLADKFYCCLTKHPELKFVGGNTSSEPLVTGIAEELYLIPGESSFYCYDVREISKHLGGKEYDFILMDPPWWNKYIRRKRKKNYKFGYDMLYHRDLSSININSLLNKNGIIGVWCTSAPSHINAILSELFEAWDMEFIGQWFWLKVTKYGKPICEFSESLGKQPFERILFGVRKNSKRSFLNPENNKVIMSIPSAIHSHKPPLTEILKPYLPQNPKCLELFARYLLPNWTSYGNEVLKLQHMSLYNEAEVDEKG